MRGDGGGHVSRVYTNFFSNRCQPAELFHSGCRIHRSFLLLFSFDAKNLPGSGNGMLLVATAWKSRETLNLQFTSGRRLSLPRSPLSLPPPLSLLAKRIRICTRKIYPVNRITNSARCTRYTMFFFYLTMLRVNFAGRVKLASHIEEKLWANIHNDYTSVTTIVVVKAFWCEKPSVFNHFTNNFWRQEYSERVPVNARRYIYYDIQSAFVLIMFVKNRY